MGICSLDFCDSVYFLERELETKDVCFEIAVTVLACLFVWFRQVMKREERYGSGSSFV